MRPEGMWSLASKAVSMRAKTILAILALLMAAPLALAQDNTNSGGDAGDGEHDVDINPPDNIDVDFTNNDNDGANDAGVDESVGAAGWGATTILIVVVVAVLVIALVVGLAGRDRWW